MEVQRLAGELQQQLRERPWTTTAALVGVGWILGRSLPLRALVAVAGIGARAAVAGALEDLVRERTRGVHDREET